MQNKAIVYDFEKISKKKEQSLKATENVKKLLQEYLDTNNNDVFNKLHDLIFDENVLIYGELNHLRIISEIIIEEKRKSMRFSLHSGIKTIAELMERYYKFIFYLRRIEVNLDENGITEAVSYLKNNKISAVCVVILLKEDLFCQPCYTAQQTFELLKDEMMMDERSEWVAIMTGTYGTDTFILEYASACIDAKNYKQAIALLKEVKKQTADILSLIESLEMLDE